MMKRLSVFLVVLMILSSCGSSVTETTSGRDTSLSDIVINDVGNGKDASLKDVILEDSVIKDSEVFTDAEMDGSESDGETGDSGVVEDVVAEDIVVDDVIEEDVSTSDTLNDIGSTDVGADVSEDAGTTYCNVGDEKPYTCPDGSTVPECVCEYKGCMPKCDYIGTRSEGWYDCAGKLIRYASCAKCTVRCDALGSKSEGWYSDCDGLITYDQCAPEWKCVQDPSSLCKTYCKSSCDCPKDAPLCVNGICDSPILIGCNGDNNLCECGKYCSGNLCEPGTTSCLTSCDCKSGQICVNETCKDKFGSDSKKEPCPCGQHCVENEFGSFCQKGCESNCDCPSDAPICINGFNGYFCGKLDIPDCGNDDRNCPCMYVCINGKCEKSVDICNSSCDCKDPAKPSCINMVCSKTPVQCASDSECPCRQSCVEGICKEVVRCLSACDCDSDEICRNNICTPKADNSCFSSDDCPCNYLCQKFQCVKAQTCKYSCDCPSSQTPSVCKNGLCQPGSGGNRCVTDNDCICGNYCSINGFCVQGCNDGCDCPKETPYCLSNKCLPAIINCKQDSECRCGEVCVNGSCVKQ